MAHELRTPITLISGHIQSLLRQGAPPALTPSLLLMQSEAQRMTSLISDLLDLARHDSKRLRLQCQFIQADDMILEVFERMRIKAAGRLKLAPVTDEAEPSKTGFGDPDRVQQCLMALVDNALQYGPADGSITMSSSTNPDGALIFHVQDQGSGVPIEEREEIFERFVRGSAAAQGSSRGSGLGLAVVKLLMQAMGGSVMVCNPPTGGADFQLHLPQIPTGAERKG